jgi:tRNA-specific 2-thiouridylase
MLKELKNKQVTKKKVFVMMSGGVDSSVAALLLSTQSGSAPGGKNYDVVGIYIKGYNLDGCSQRDAEDARKTATKIGIPFYVWDLEKEYKRLVVDYMISGYKKGITPNPDVMCNKKIKFGLFFDKAMKAGADYVATGHYVRLRREIRNSKFEIQKLFIAKDSDKDQSYFLWALNKKQLSRCLFPIGNYLKSEVRIIAKRAGLPTASKKDSQGICFLGKISISEFLKKYIPQKQGLVLNAKREVVGKHKGASFYTIGQRHGLGIPATKPYYVVKKDVKKNIIQGAEAGDARSAKKEIFLKNLNWLIDKPKMPISVLVRLRYRQPLVKARLVKAAGKYKLIFALPQKFVAPGQSAVFYSLKGFSAKVTEDREILGGGEIV